MNGFEPLPVPRRSLWARLLRRRSHRDAYLVVRNLVAATPLRQLTREQVDEALGAGAAGGPQAAEALRRVYAMVMRNAARDLEISDEEVADLAHVRHAFGLSDADVAEVERALIEDAYRTQARAALGDARLTEEEKQRLHELAGRLRLPEDLAAEIRQEEAGRVFERVFRAAIVDRRLSEDEEGHLNRLAANLGVRVTPDQATVRQLDRFRLLWRIEQGELPRLEAPLPLQHGESVHSSVPAERRAAKEARASGPTRGVRLGRAVHWSLDHPLPVDDPRWGGPERGTLHVTSRRLAFETAGLHHADPLEDIIRITVHRDGLEVELDGGQDLLYRLEGDAEIEGAILGTALRATRPRPA